MILAFTGVGNGFKSCSLGVSVSLVLISCVVAMSVAGMMAVTFAWKGDTPASCACFSGHTACLKVLAKHKADLSTPTKKVRTQLCP